MTNQKLEALIELKAKVEAGIVPVYGRADPCGIGPGRVHLREACGGSVDAALALKDATLPEFAASIDTFGNAWVYIPTRNAPPVMEARAQNDDPSRALLLANIEALIEKAKAND